MGVACLGLARWGIGWINPCQEGINGSPYQFRYRHAFPLRSHMKTFQLLFSYVDICAFHASIRLDVCYPLV